MPASQSQSAKGNPASHRMSNPRNKKGEGYRAKRRREQEKRKDKLKEQVAEAEARNKKLRKMGELTPWEWAKQHGKTAKAKTNQAFKV